MVSIGIRELRQRASKYIAMVRRGDTVQVTDRGRPVALLVPIPEDGILDRLAAQGRLSPEAGDLLDLGAPLPAATGKPLPSSVLSEIRADER
jgi:prevent-host-death family protein